mgnify:CR=1 FL=1
MKCAGLSFSPVARSSSSGVEYMLAWLHTLSRRQSLSEAQIEVLKVDEDGIARTALDGFIHQHVQGIFIKRNFTDHFRESHAGEIPQMVTQLHALFLQDIAADTPEFYVRSQSTQTWKECVRVFFTRGLAGDEQDISHGT